MEGFFTVNLLASVGRKSGYFLLFVVVVSFLRLENSRTVAHWFVPSFFVHFVFCVFFPIYNFLFHYSLWFLDTLKIASSQLVIASLLLQMLQ